MGTSRAARIPVDRASPADLMQLATDVGPGNPLSAELRQAARGWAGPLAACAGLTLGYCEHHCDAAWYRESTDLCLAAGWARRSIEAWIKVGRQRAGTAVMLTHKACVLAE